MATDLAVHNGLLPLSFCKVQNDCISAFLLILCASRSIMYFFVNSTDCLQVKDGKGVLVSVSTTINVSAVVAARKRHQD